jgi:hypothetical protein
LQTAILFKPKGNRLVGKRKMRSERDDTTLNWQHLRKEKGKEKEDPLKADVNDGNV